MGQESIVMTRDLGEALPQALAALDLQVIMVDGQLVLPSALPPARWQELRLRGAAGMITLRNAGSEDGVAVVVFGNAGTELLALRDRLAAALKAG
jgi:hypothetical protein